MINEKIKEWVEIEGHMLTRASFTHPQDHNPYKKYNAVIVTD